MRNPGNNRRRHLDRRNGHHFDVQFLDDFLAGIGLTLDYCPAAGLRLAGCVKGNGKRRQEPPGNEAKAKEENEEKEAPVFRAENGHANTDFREMTDFGRHRFRHRK